MPEIPDHAVLAVLDEEEAKEILDFNAKKMGAEHLAKELAKLIGECNQGIDKWFADIKRKYNIDEEMVYFNSTTRELRKGRV